MGIHLPTIVLVIAISSVLNFFMLLGQYLINRKFPGVLYWLCGFVIIAASQFLLYLGDGFDDVFKVSIGDVLMVTGFVIISVGMKLFFRFKVKRPIYFALLCFQLVWSFSFNFHRNTNLEQAGFFAVLTIICAIVAIDLYRYYRQSRTLTAIILSCLFFLYGSLFLVEGIINISNLHVPDFAPSALMMSVIYLCSYATSTIATFCFVMLVNHELITDRQLALNALQESKESYRQDSVFLQSVLESPQDIIIFSLDSKYRYTKFTSFHKAVMRKIWGVNIEVGINMLDVISSPADQEKAKANFDRALKGEFFVEEEDYGDEKLLRAFYENRYSPIKNPYGEIIGLSVFVIDITERRIAERQILESKNHFETLFKISPDATLITKLPGGEIVDVNEAFLAGTGFSREEAIGNSSLSLGLWANEADREVFVQTMMSKGIFLNFEVDFVKKDGSANPGSISAKAYTVNGVTYVISITHSLAERKKREEALHLAQYAISQSTDAVFWVREDGSFYDVNHSAEQLLGYSRQELLSLSVPQIDPHFNDIRWRNHWLQLKQEKNIIVSTSQVRKDGTTIFTEVNANYINYKGIELLCSFVQDVTERKRAEEEKEKVQRDFDALISSTGDLMWSVDSDCRLIAGNKAFIKNAKQFTGKEFKNGDLLLGEAYIDKDYAAYWKSLYNKALTGKDFQIELNIPVPETGLERWVEIHLNPIFNGELVTGVACFGKDITGRKQQEQTLRELNRQVQQRAEELALSNRELEQFAYVASHDLQEPLRMVTSFLKLLEKRFSGKLDDKGLQFIYFAVDGAERMRQIILDLLEYSRVGKIERPAELVDMNVMMTDIMHINGIAIEERKASLTWGQLPVVNTDKLSLQQVLQNLVANALKYNRPGIPPVVKVHATEQEEFWQVEIADNGIGIEPAFYDKIFVVFQRLHTNENYKGSGIGLSICKKIIEKQGGSIWVKSEPGRGSSFYFTIKKA